MSSVLDLINIHFFNAPKLRRWSKANREVILFNEEVTLSVTKQLLVDVSITAEIANNSPFAYNRYKLYINNRQVTQGGFEATSDILAPNMASTSLTWGGKINSSCDCNFIFARVKVTAQTFGAGNPTSNVDNSFGNFRGTKAATLRVTVI
jgi:hypothetical protein